MRKRTESEDARKHVWDSITRKGTIKDVEILKEEVKGEGATVSFKITYKDGKRVKFTEDLVKKDGRWKVSFLETKAEAEPS